MDFKWPMKKRKVQSQHLTQLELNADEVLPISRWDSYTVGEVLLEEAPTLLDSLSLDLPRPAQTTFKPTISWQMSFPTALEARELNPSFKRPRFAYSSPGPCHCQSTVFNPGTLGSISRTLTQVKTETYQPR